MSSRAGEYKRGDGFGILFALGSPGRWMRNQGVVVVGIGERAQLRTQVIPKFSSKSRLMPWASNCNNPMGCVIGIERNGGTYGIERNGCMRAKVLTHVSWMFAGSGCR